jgi:hypothetical protein
MQEIELQNGDFQISGIQGLDLDESGKAASSRCSVWEGCLI